MTAGRWVARNPQMATEVTGDRTRWLWRDRPLAPTLFHRSVHEQTDHR